MIFFNSINFETKSIVSHFFAIRQKYFFVQNCQKTFDTSSYFSFKCASNEIDEKALKTASSSVYCKISADSDHQKSLPQFCHHFFKNFIK